MTGEPELLFRREVLDAIDRHLAASYPDEGCGYAVGPARVPDVTRFEPMENLQDRYHALDPATYPRTARTAYMMDPLRIERAFEAAHARGEPIKVIVHSHPDHDAYFSAEDVAFATVEAAPVRHCCYLVVSVRDGRVVDRKLFGWARGWVETAIRTKENE